MKFCALILFFVVFAGCSDQKADAVLQKAIAWKDKRGAVIHRVRESFEGSESSRATAWKEFDSAFDTVYESDFAVFHPAQNNWSVTIEKCGVWWDR